MTRRTAILLLLAGLLLAFLPVFLPLYFIQPFRAQHTGSFLFSLRLHDLAPWITALAFLMVAVSSFVLWYPRSVWRRAGLVLALAFAGFFTYASHVNVYEIMFHPFPQVRNVPAAEAKLDPGEMVLSVKIGGEARAYPVTYLAYHHIANDTLGGVPLVATY